jgi:2-succinyl-6-hydroxy-2,4-cyclohexadiene-1-carboxylate synthase
VRPPLVLLHGFTQTHRSWDGVIAAIGGGARVLAPDLPGHGSAAARPASFAACTAYLRALAGDPPTAIRGATGDGRFSLAGYSMGGRIALATALALRGHVDRLILIGASPGLADEAERAQRRAADDALAERILATGVEAFAREWGAQPLFAGQPPEVAAAAHADRLRNTPEGLAAALRGLGTGVMEPLWDRLGELAMPVTLVVGERDEKFRAVAERMASALPRAELRVVPGAAHAAHLERPDVVAAVIGGDAPTV